MKFIYTSTVLEELQKRLKMHTDDKGLAKFIRDNQDIITKAIDVGAQNPCYPEQLLGDQYNRGWTCGICGNHSKDGTLIKHKKECKYRLLMVAAGSDAYDPA